MITTNVFSLELFFTEEWCLLAFNRLKEKCYLRIYISIYFQEYWIIKKVEFSLFVFNASTLYITVNFTTDLKEIVLDDNKTDKILNIKLA